MARACVAKIETCFPDWIECSRSFQWFAEAWGHCSLGRWREPSPRFGWAFSFCSLPRSRKDSMARYFPGRGELLVGAIMLVLSRTVGKNLMTFQPSDDRRLLCYLDRWFGVLDFTGRGAASRRYPESLGEERKRGQTKDIP